MSWATARPVVAAVSALLAVAGVAAHLGTSVAGPVVVWFLLVGPGMTVVHLLGLDDPLPEVVATVAISIALGVAVAEALLFLGLWSPVLLLLILAALTLAGAALSTTWFPGSRALSARDGS